MTQKPRLIVFASGTETAGGIGFANLVHHARSPFHSLEADIVAVVSNHAAGGVCTRASQLHIPFIHFNGPLSKDAYRRILSSTGAEWIALSGWMRQTTGLDPERTFNIHPAPLSLLGGRFGGEGMYGIRVHHAVHAALHNDEITRSGVSMHFVTEEYDEGPVFFECPVPIHKHMSPEAIQKKTALAEHHWQPRIANMVLRGDIAWDGKDPESLIVPDGYQFLPKKTDE